MERKIVSRKINKLQKVVDTHANGVRRSLGFPLYLYTFGQFRWTGFVIIKLIRLDPHTNNFVSLNIHPFRDWGIQQLSAGGKGGIWDPEMAAFVWVASVEMIQDR